MIDFPEGTVIDTTKWGTLATAYPEGYITIQIHTLEGKRVTLRLEGWEAKALITTLQRVCENLDK